MGNGTLNEPTGVTENCLDARLNGMGIYIYYMFIENEILFEQIKNLNLNSVALVRERTIPTERPPPVGEVSASADSVF